MHLGYDIFELVSLFTHLFLFVPIFTHVAPWISPHHGDPEKAGVMSHIELSPPWEPDVYPVGLVALPCYTEVP